MNKDELIERFDNVNEDGEMLRKCFSMLVDISEKSAASFLECLEGTHEYNNYLTEQEAMEIAKHLVNRDRTTGPKWTPDTLFNKVEGLGGEVDRMPLYNKWALYVAMNVQHSDHQKTIERWAGGDANTYALECYNLAVEQLSDTDRPRWIREYFNV